MLALETEELPLVGGGLVDIGESPLSFFIVHVMSRMEKAFAAKYHQEPNRTTVAGRLKHLVSEGKLVLVTQGQGRQASIFRRVVTPRPINGVEMT
jgi:hypothetical protein